MAHKRHKPEEIVGKLRQVEALVGQGMDRIGAIRQVWITEQTYYRWRRKYGGMGTDGPPPLALELFIFLSEPTPPPRRRLSARLTAVIGIGTLEGRYRLTAVPTFPAVERPPAGGPG